MAKHIKAPRELEATILDDDDQVYGRIKVSAGRIQWVRGGGRKWHTASLAKFVTWIEHKKKPIMPILPPL